MRTSTLVSFAVSVVVGSAITLLSKFIQTPRPQLGVDVVYWGIPLSWTMWVIPTRFQSIDWFNFFADFLFWVIIILIVSTSAMRFGIRKIIQSRSATTETITQS